MYLFAAPLPIIDQGFQLGYAGGLSPGSVFLECRARLSLRSVLQTLFDLLPPWVVAVPLAGGLFLSAHEEVMNMTYMTLIRQQGLQLGQHIVSG
jgi:hypothetical protein